MSALNVAVDRASREKYFSLYLLVICVAAAARIYSLDTSSLWADELWGVDACSQGSWWAMILNLVYKDSHPPGYQTLLYFWMKWLGQADAVVRLPSVIAGVFSVAALYRFGRTFFSPAVGLLAAAMLAVSHHAIYYSQEARAYVFLILFAILHYHAFFQLFLRGERTRANWLVFWLIGALLGYFHYMGVVILMAEALVLILLLPKHEKFPLFFRAYLPIAVLYLPWCLVMYRHLFFSDASWETAVPDGQILEQTIRFVLGPDSFRFYSGVFCLLVFLLSGAYSAANSRLSFTQRVLLLLLLMSFLPIVFFYLKSHWGRSAYTIRHFTYLIPVFLLVVSWFLEVIIRWRGWQELRALWFFACVIIVGSIMLNISTSLTVGGKLYNDFSKIEYRQSIGVILQDKSFAEKSKGDVFISNKFFDHYLLASGLRKRPAPFFHQDSPEKFPEYRQLIQKRNMTEFYYLEVFQNVDTGEPSPVLQELLKHYFAVCATQFVWTQAIKFSTQLPPRGDQLLPTCPTDRPLAVVSR